MRHLLLLALATASPSPDRELSLGGIVLGQSETSVIQAHGSPKSRAEGGSDYLPVRLSYPGLTVLLDEQGVGGWRSAGPAGSAARSMGDGRRCHGKPVKYDMEAFPTLQGTFTEIHMNDVLHVAPIICICSSGTVPSGNATFASATA